MEFTHKRSARSPLLGALLVAAAVGGCEGSAAPQGGAGAGIGAAAAAPAAIPTALRLEVSAEGLGGATLGPIRLLAERLDNGQRRVLPLTDEISAWPATFEVDDLPPGPYRLTVFWDRDRDGRFDACPFPAMPDHPEQADRFDNLHAVAELTLAGEQSLALTLERHICGPGDLRTGLRGELIPPLNGAIDGIPTYLLLEPLSAEPAPRATASAASGPATGTARGPLRVPLFPAGLTEPATFEVGELVPGRYRLTFFADADGDRAPSPCTADGPGGGDRFVTVVEEVEVVAGERRALEASVSLARGRCPAGLTGLRGVVGAEEGLREALGADEGGADGAYGLLDGPVHLALFPPGGKDAVVEVRLLRGLGAEPLPHPFAVSGLPPGAWRMVAWVDRDGDEAFTPCNGLPAGLDAIYVGVDVRVVDGHMSDVGELDLLRAECEDLQPAGLRGRVRVESEAGSVGSGRPLRLELYPADPGGERRSVQLFENHRTLPGLEDDEGAPFTVTGGLPEGRYRAVAYLDTDRDGNFTGCPDAAFADRAASGLLGECSDDECPRFEITEGVLVDLGELVVRSLGCEVPAASVTLEVGSPEALPAELSSAGPLRLAIEEAGGWADDRPLDSRLLSGERVALPTLRLAPGQYKLTVYVDGDGDGRFTPCEGGDPLSGRVELLLDEDRADAEVSLSLDRTCTSR